MAVTLDIAPLAMEKTGIKKDALAGEVAVVTGGTSNIGLATARSLAWLGAKVVIVARNAEKGAAAAELIDRENQPRTAVSVSTDVSDEASMKAMAKRAFDAFGKVDILVNNAMDLSLAAPIMKSTVQQLDRQYEIAARGALIGIQCFVPGMQQRRHGVVTYLSTAFQFPMGPSNYCAAKSAANSIILSLAAELGAYKDTGIGVFSFLPMTVGRPRQAPPPGLADLAVDHKMAGYDGPIPPEDCGAALAYCITRAGDLHGSGIIIGQAFRQMKWPYPKPETVPARDWDRVNDRVTPLLFGYIGQGFPDPIVPLVTINRSDALRRQAERAARPPAPS